MTLNRKTGGFLLAMLPFVIFACTYSLMNLCPNYRVNPIDTQGTYQLELRLFPVHDGAQTLIPSAWCQAHHTAAADILSGLFYLLWVPLPVAFCIYLCVIGSHRAAFRFSLCFLFVNLVGFVGYYVHPAAPPWYVLYYGFQPDVHTPGNVAGFRHFDELTGIPVFHAIYARNANVFAAIPSLHAAYNPVALYYAVRTRHTRWAVMLAVVSVGICCSAVYSAHHYIIDVLLGLLTAFVGIFLFQLLERCLLSKIAH